MITHDTSVARRHTENRCHEQGAPNDPPGFRYGQVLMATSAITSGNPSVLFHVLA